MLFAGAGIVIPDVTRRVCRQNPLHKSTVLLHEMPEERFGALVSDFTVGGEVVGDELHIGLR